MNRILRYLIAAILVLLFSNNTILFGKPAANITLNIIVKEKNSDITLPGATIMFPQYGMWGITDINGKCIIKKVPAGYTTITIRMVGMVTVEKKFNPSDYIKKDFIVEMAEENFGLSEVIITAQNNKVGASTASSISRNAIDHLQATSLADIMELLPGQTASNPSLSSPSKATIRQINGDALNSLGTSIVVNGAPISNNANLQTGNTAANGGLNTDFTSTAGSGSDLRQISADNVESVDIIRGIPSVEYGDMTSGVIIINPKAGEYPWQVKTKINPTLTQGSLGKGFKLKNNFGNISIDADYAKSLSDERRPYQGYSRISSNVLYSKVFNDNISTTTGLSFGSDVDAQKLDPSDKRYQRKRSSSNNNLRFNTNIIWSPEKKYLKYIRLNLSAEYAIQKGYFQELQGNFGYMISTAMVDGCVTSNKGVPIENIWGTVITNNDIIDPSAKTNFLPYEFLTKSTTNGKPFNFFAKLTTCHNFNILGTNNKILFGADWKSDKNFGEGVVFDPLYPPKPGVRMRPFKSIPALNQGGVFLEENGEFNILKRALNIQAGVRAEIIQPFEDNSFFGVSPRFNVSYDLIPKHLTIRGGWGITVKAPTLLYLYPDKAYFDFVNYDNIATTQANSEERLSIITTKVFDTTNNDLKIAKNRKQEVGFDLKIGQFEASVTAYDEKMTNGYSFGVDYSTYSLFEYIKYKGSDREGTYPELSKDGSTNVVLNYYKPLNNKESINKGVEFDFNFGQIKSIRTSFLFNGAYMLSKNYGTGESYFQKSPDTNGNYKDIGVYAPGDGSQYERFLTTLRIVHNIPKIKFLISFSIQTIWSDKHKYLGLENTKPIAYISASNLSYNKINPGDNYSSDIQKQILENRNITESYNPLWLCNLRLTKEFNKWGGLAFFVNNLFMTQPYEESKRNPGNYKQRNPEQFFGAEIWLKL